MKLFYDTSTGIPLHTVVSGTYDGRDRDDWIEIPDTFDMTALPDFRVEDGQLVARGVECACAAALAHVNAACGKKRYQFITAIPGQEMVCLAKETEAKAYAALAILPHDLSNFPLLAAEVGITAPSAYELAQIWLNLAAVWRDTAGAIEGARMTAVNAIREATSKAQIDTAVQALESALAQIT